LVDTDGSLANITDFQTDLNSVNAPVPMQNAPFSAVPSITAPAPAVPVQVPQNVAPAPVQSVSPVTPAAAGPKRKHTQKVPQVTTEEVAGNAAEEDKRRRNTAASARFRVKKKMREQALERTVKDTNEKNSALEARVSQLELENHWLRGLIMEKNGTEERNEASEKAISDMFKSFLASRNELSSSLSESKHGVGTIA
jgi:hypothetical protein